MKKNLFFALALLAWTALGPSPALGAEEVAGIPGLHHFRLANGLEIYAYRDAAVPLARIQIAFRTGAISQKSDTAGLFHLYEHMLFRGSKSHPGTAGVKAALASLGVSEWNGGTSAERVDYWITLPSSEIAQGLAFWAETLTSPNLDEAALSAEKDIVIQEIRGRLSDPDSIYEAAFTKRLFSKYPWRRDPAGSEKAVLAATAASLKALASTWFVPNNAALFVGGDVDPDEVRAAAEEAFGAWPAGPNPWSVPLPPNPKPGVARPTWIVYPDLSMPEGIGRVEARYRGPDLASDPASSYAADLWSALVSPPEGRFKTALAANVPKLGGKDSIVASYVSQRDGGWITISSYFAADPASPAVDRARAFKEQARAFEITSMKANPSYFSTAEYEAARKRLLDDRDMATYTAEGMIEALTFWWAAASVDYFASYPSALAKTGPKEVSAFLDSYVMRNLEVVALRMNPADIEREKRSFAGSGFETVSASNAFWWQK
jgi:zinc protease